MELPDDMKEWVEKGGAKRAVRALPDEETLKRKSRVYMALSDPIRLKILYLLSIHPLCVCLLKKAIDISDSKLSYHLSVLKDSELISGERKKNWIVYRITDEGLRYIEA